MDPSELGWLDAVEIARRVNAGELDPQAVTAEHLARIARLNPRLNAYVDVDERARAGAAGLLAGVTAGAKESYQVRGMSWTWSSPKYREQRAMVDSAPIARYREAGAAILGKTNIPELVASVGTVSPLFGPTQNPWRDGVTPGGSSGRQRRGGRRRPRHGGDRGRPRRLDPDAGQLLRRRRPEADPGCDPGRLPDPSTFNSRA